MKPFSFIKPVTLSKPDKSLVKIIYPESYKHLKTLINDMDQIVAVDIETNGTKVHLDSYVVGIGIADANHIYYFPIDKQKTYNDLLGLLKSKTLIGFNINFDASYFHRDYSKYIKQPISGPNLKWHDWKYDCYALYKQLANEGWPGQTWNLKGAQLDLLGWEDKGDVELRKWLIDNNHYTSVSLEEKNGYDYRADIERYCKPDLSKMYLAPPEILGYYCGLDAYSTYLLYDKIFKPSIETLPDSAQSLFWFYHTELFIVSVKWNIEQQLRGLVINTDNLKSYMTELEQEIINEKERFLTHKDVAPYLEERRQMALASHKAKQPKEFNKDGSKSKTYLKWLQKHENKQARSYFNMNSGRHLQWLFYEKLKYPVLLRTKNNNPAVDKKALMAWGETGQILKSHNDKVKELSYVQACIDMTENDILHPQYRIPGTLTCRIAGSGSFNVQQQPKSKRYLKEWVPRKGMTWVDADVESLEAVVLAELSQDKTMRLLYDPSQAKNDIYLYVGAFLPGIKTNILKYYDPHNPTVEGIALAKKHCKKERQIAKTCVLGFQYGMGPKKLHMSLRLQGVELTEQDAYEIYKAYWDLFQGIKDYQQHLETEWRRKNGWVYNGIGRPVCIFEGMMKDIVNRVVQSTGHDILMYINYQLYQLRDESNINFYPIIIDWHDASLVECSEADGEAVINLFKKAYELTNEWLDGDLLIRTVPQIVNNLSESKCE